MSDRIVEHHIKYIETHGYDETILITDTEHQNIDHRKLFPMCTPEELAVISRKAYFRSDKTKMKKADRIRKELALIYSVNLKDVVREKPII